MPLVALSQGFSAVVDDEDYARVNEFRWVAQRREHTVYALRSGPRALCWMYLHTFLTGFERVDHINGDGLDNRRANLRPCAQWQNLGNTRKRPGTTAAYKGVCRYAPNRWRAYIGSGRTQRHLGVFDSPEAAARAYDAAARERFGDFAALNFALPEEQSAMRGVSHQGHV